MTTLQVFALATTGLMASSFGTDRFYSDFDERSPNGRFELTARSPDNAPGKPRIAFQSNFTYTLRDRRSGKVLWRKREGRGYLLGVHIHDSGWTVASEDSIRCIAPDGRDTGTIDLLQDGFRRRDVKAHVHDTTAGPMWRKLSWETFLEHEGRLYFYVRPWWGDRVVIDVAAGKQTRVSDSILRHCRAIEKEECLRSLRAGVANRKQMEADCCSQLGCAAVRGAWLAGVLPVRESVPLLRKLEDSEMSMKSASGWGDDSPPGTITVASYTELSLRKAVHLSLRRLDEVPGPFPILRPNRNVKSFNDRLAPLPKLAAAGETRADSLAAGMSPEQVVKAIGFPDEIAHDDSVKGFPTTWEYDMDTVRPFTLVIVWEKRRIAKLLRLLPARWQSGTLRDEALAE